MGLSWTFAPGRQKNPSLFLFLFLFLLLFCFVLFCFVLFCFVLFCFSEKSYAGQLGSLQFLKEHSLEIEYYQKSTNVDRESSIAVF